VEQRTIVLVGLNHRTAPVEVRERLAFGNGRLEPALRELIAVPCILEGAIVSTCNRVEVIACGADAAAVGSALPAFLAREHGVADPALATHLYTHADREAVRHLFRVAASLDSMVYLIFSEMVSTSRMFTWPDSLTSLATFCGTDKS